MNIKEIWKQLEDMIKLTIEDAIRRSQSPIKEILSTTFRKNANELKQPQNQLDMKDVLVDENVPYITSE